MARPPVRISWVHYNGLRKTDRHRTMAYKTIEDTIGNTPLVRLQRIPGTAIEARGNVILGKLEGNNPAGSVKDRPAVSMIRHAEERGRIKPGDTLIEATSGNTGIALAMAAAIRGYRMVLIMPEDLSLERRQSMAAYGAEIILTPVKGGMEYARDLADAMEREGKGVILDQFANPDNPLAHYETTGPEIWRDTEGRHPLRFGDGHHGHDHRRVALSEGKESADPDHRRAAGEGSRIPGIRKWPEAYLPKIYDPKFIDRQEPVTQADAEHMARRMAREEGIFCGISPQAPCAWRCGLPKKSRMRRSCSSCAIAATAICRRACSRPDRPDAPERKAPQACAAGPFLPLGVQAIAAFTASPADTPPAHRRSCGCSASARRSCAGRSCIRSAGQALAGRRSARRFRLRGRRRSARPRAVRRA
jgi:cysteine synthase B